MPQTARLLIPWWCLSYIYMETSLGFTGSKPGQAHAIRKVNNTYRASRWTLCGWIQCVLSYRPKTRKSSKGIWYETAADDRRYEVFGDRLGAMIEMNKKKKQSRIWYKRGTSKWRLFVVRFKKRMVGLDEDWLRVFIGWHK